MGSIEGQEKVWKEKEAELFGPSVAHMINICLYAKIFFKVKIFQLGLEKVCIDCTLLKSSTTFSIFLRKCCWSSNLYKNCNSEKTSKYIPHSSPSKCFYHEKWHCDHLKISKFYNFYDYALKFRPIIDFRVSLILSQLLFFAVTRQWHHQA